MKYKHELGFVLIAAALGPLIGGIIWLLLYMLNVGFVVNFHGPAVVCMLIFMISSWLLVSAAAIVLYTRGNHKRQLPLAIGLTLVFGAVSIASASFSFAQFAVN